MELAPIEVIQEIFQCVVDEEASILDHNQYLTVVHKPPNLKAPASLALVSHKWKEIIYDTPSLWSIIVLNMSAQRDKVRAQYNRRVGLFKQSPIDLYILFAHLEGDVWYRRKSANFDDVIVSTIPAIQNVRKLVISTSQPVAMDRALTLFIPLTEQMEEMRLVFRDIKELCFALPPIELDTLITDKDFGRLVKLYIGEVGALALPWAERRTFFPNVRDLEMDSKQRASFNELRYAQIISHCPNVRVLRLSSTHSNTTDGQFFTFKLNNLRNLTCLGSTHTLGMFAQGRIEANFIHAYECHQWHGSYNQTTHDFLTSTPSVEEVTLHIRGPERWGDALAGAFSVESLNLIITYEGGGEPIVALVNPIQLHPKPVVIAPSLKRLHVEIPTISADWFRQLVQVRCLVVKETGRTKVDCIPLEYLELRLPKSNASTVRASLRRTVEWKTAEIEHKVEEEHEKFRLKWREN